MIRAKHHRVIYPVFIWLTKFLVKRYFTSVKIAGEFTDNGAAVLVLANHVSWWDGFWIEYFNLKKLHRRLHFMMLEEQLTKHWYFRYAGGYSVKLKSREIIESIAYTLELLRDSGNFVFMFPQGKIHSAHTGSVHFERGIGNIVNKCADDTQIVFMANLTDYFSDFKPHLFIYTKTVTAASLKDQDIGEEYNRFYHDVLTHHKKLTS